MDNDTEVIEAAESLPEKPSKRIGRPSKALLKSKRKGNQKRVGRPVGDHVRYEDFKARLLASPRSRKVFDAILDAALDPENKNQAAAWKLFMERALPVSMFEKDASGGRSQININITGVSAVTGEVIEHE